MSPGVSLFVIFVTLCEDSGFYIRNVGNKVQRSGVRRPRSEISDFDFSLLLQQGFNTTENGFNTEVTKNVSVRGLESAKRSPGTMRKARRQGASVLCAPMGEAE
jgi:hypothetical protein